MRLDLRFISVSEYEEVERADGFVFERRTTCTPTPGKTSLR